MSTKNRSAETVAALLSAAPAIVPDADPARTAGEQVDDAAAEVVRPVVPAADHRAHAEDDAAELDDTDLEAFEFTADAPIVRPRRRRNPLYQTVRINRPTAAVLRAQWLLARKSDPLVTFTEFATIVCQHGLRALKEQRERGE